MNVLYLLVILLVILSSIGLTNHLVFAQNQNPPAIITQVELGSSLMSIPDNQTCTFPPDPKLNNNCLVGLVPDHKVQCSYFLGSNTCEPLHQTSTGTNRSCIEGYPLGRAPQWFDVYNTLGVMVDLENFTVSDKSNHKPYGHYGPFPNVVELRPHEKCTFPWLTLDQALAVGLNNMSMAISYNYNGKYYNASTPSLSDNHNDTQTWQFDGNKWVFAQENTIAFQESNNSLPITVSYASSGHVLFMKPDSTAKIYANFTFSVLNNKTYTLKSQILSRMTGPNFYAVGFNVTATPSFIIANTSNASVTYTITAKENTKGVYILPLYYYGFPLVVGFNESQISPELFDRLFTVKSSSPGFLPSTPTMNITGYSNMISKIITVNQKNASSVNSVNQLGALPMSPLKQFKAGVNLSDITCREGLLLITKHENNLPACVTPSTAFGLAERGWTTYVKIHNPS